MAEGLETRLAAPGPKRILSLDGGGIRALISLQYLARIETILRERFRRPDLVLADYFDLIGGTSTGSILAAALSMGWPVQRIREMYLALGERAFQPRRSWLGPLARLLGPHFDANPLEDLLREHLGDRRLDSTDLRTGLAIVAKRIDTASVWVIVNFPEHRFFEDNRALPLWKVIRASTAAPPFFRPTFFDDVGRGEPGVFVDGGMSTHLNPAFQMFMAATLDGFSLKWPTGADELLLCSIGTGVPDSTVSIASVRRFNNFQLLITLIQQLMRDASEQNRTILQWISTSPTAAVIDSQIGALDKDLLGIEPLLWYLRYNVRLEDDSLRELGLSFTPRELHGIRQMSNVSSMPALQQIGEAAAGAVTADHFPPAFDLEEMALPQGDGVS